MQTENVTENIAPHELSIITKYSVRMTTEQKTHSLKLTSLDIFLIEIAVEKLLSLAQKSKKKKNSCLFQNHSVAFWLWWRLNQCFFIDTFILEFLRV